MDNTSKKNSINNFLNYNINFGFQNSKSEFKYQILDQTFFF